MISTSTVPKIQLGGGAGLLHFCCAKETQSTSSPSEALVRVVERLLLRPRAAAHALHEHVTRTGAQLLEAPSGARGRTQQVPREAAEDDWTPRRYWNLHVGRWMGWSWGGFGGGWMDGG